ncbi:hypothetical protein EFO40_02825 [Lactococcus cremoris]|nr:hypothetical protein [Lactococcus cremoris]TEA98707.1 hypothetical protein BU174_05680 [Lactococcus cremoris]
MAILRILEPTVTGILTIKILKSMLKEQLVLLGQLEILVLKALKVILVQLVKLVSKLTWVQQEQLVKMVNLHSSVQTATGGLAMLI